MILSTPDPNPSSSSLLRKLSTKEPSLFRNNKTRRINTSPTPSATLSRIQTFGRTWLNPFTRNSKNQSSSSSPSIEPPINIFSPSNHLSTRPILSRRRPLSHFSQDQKKPLPSSIHSKQPHRRPYSTFVTKAPLNTTSSTTSSYSSSASSTSLASKSSSSSTNVECCPCCYTPSPTFSSTTSSSSITNMTSNPQSDLEPITALDFLLDDRQQQQKQQQHQDSGHAFFQQVTEESSHNNKPKKVGTMHRISVPVRSCSSLFQQQQQQNSITSSDIKSSSISSSSSSSKQPLFTSLPSTPTGSISFQWQPQQSRKRLTSLESPLLPSRARSVFGKLDHQQKEQKAILAWRTTVTQLIQQKEECQQQEKQQQWPLSSCVTNRLDDKTEAKWLALRKFIIHEIYATEESYHELLLLVQTRYMTPMLRASQEKDPLVKSNDVPILFHHLPTLIGLSSRILATRTSAPDKRPMDFLVPSLGHQWLQFQEEWVVFLKYAVHFEVNTKSIKRACTNGLLLKIEQESLTRRDTKRMGMADYLIAPIQRVPRYCLLLKDLLKYTPTTHDDYWDLVKVFDTMTGLARAMNDTQKLHRRKTTMA